MQGPAYPFMNMCETHFATVSPNACQFHWSYTLTLAWSTDSIMNIAGILHHWFHIINPLDEFSLYYSALRILQTA